MLIDISWIRSDCSDCAQKAASNHAEQKQSWNGLTISKGSINDAFSHSAFFLIGGIALKSINSSLAYGMLSISSGLFVSKLVINAIDSYNEQALREIKVNFCDFHDKNPRIRTIFLLFVIAIGLISSSTACLLGLVGGTILGITLTEELRKAAKNINKTQKA
jgi:hypothetical protein